MAWLGHAGGAADTPRQLSPIASVAAGKAEDARRSFDPVWEIAPGRDRQAASLPEVPLSYLPCLGGGIMGEGSLRKRRVPRRNTVLLYHLVRRASDGHQGLCY